MTDLPTPVPVPASPPPDPWSDLQAFTAARIALGRSGTSVPLRESLAFKLAHAYARDAVYSSLKVDTLISGLQIIDLPFLQVRSRAQTRTDYLQHPDWGRQLDAESRAVLACHTASSYDLTIILADGLSATAINDHALPLLSLLLPQLRQSCFHLSPIIVAEQARVALGDEIGHLLNARLTLILIGERPGLSSPNSLGAYFTYAPHPGLTDEARNCISNIRPEGLSYQLAAHKLCIMLREALRLQLSGVNLKDQPDLFNN